jgi:isoleucyl-tRNA synthetase
MRWWVASLPYENDVKVDLEFFTLSGESYRKVRNTLRFMLSNLFDAADQGAGEQWGGASLEAWVLGEFDAVSRAVKAAYAAYDYKSAHARLYGFCNDTLSAVYLAAVKDRLYCDKPGSPRRRRTQAALALMTDGLCRLLAPMLPHTADESYRALHKAGPDSDACVHLQTFLPESGASPDAAWARVLELRSAAMVAIERTRQEIRAREAQDPKGAEPMDFWVTLPDADGALSSFDPVDLADLLGVSRVIIEHGAGEVRVQDRRDQPQCARSWKRDGTVRQRSDGGLLSDRDAHAVGVQ